MLRVRLLPTALPELFASASHTGCLTVADRYGLMAALLEDSLVEEDRCAVDRLLHAVRRGRIAIVDEISVVL
ncbi:MAG TPA: hypothetical protein V6D50_13075 [Chroococcales cyanobacterium]